jgi:hypothetical protein
MLSSFHVEDEEKSSFVMTLDNQMKDFDKTVIEMDKDIQYQYGTLF